MFSFHKPKVYRSTTGCCICKAKSSSSRFTDSKKYEIDFLECFQLETPRKGEICNACVLLVKRFKRLPPGSDRHWGHVVDARVGPGLKSMTKFKKRKEEQNNAAALIDGASSSKTSLTVPERFCKIFKKSKKKTKFNGRKDSASSDENSGSPVPTRKEIEAIERSYKFHVNSFSPCNDCSGPPTKSKCRRKSYQPYKNRRVMDATVIDDDIWVKRHTCCGYVYESSIHSAIIIDLDLYRPCVGHTARESVNIYVPDKTDNLNAIDLNDDDVDEDDDDEEEDDDDEDDDDDDVLHTNDDDEDEILSKIIGQQLKLSTPVVTANKITDFTACSNSVKETDSFNNSSTAVKKHHLYSKRQNIMETNKTDALAILYETSDLILNANDNIINTHPDTYLHKLKNESLKRSITYSPVMDRVTASKIKADFHVSRNLVNSTEKPKRPKLDANGILLQGEVPIAGKFVSDNSSDSGYEENSMMQDHLQGKLLGRPALFGHSQPISLNKNMVEMLPSTSSNVQLKSPDKFQQKMSTSNRFAPTEADVNIVYVQNSPIKGNLLIETKHANKLVQSNKVQKQQQHNNNNNVRMIKPKYLNLQHETDN